MSALSFSSLASCRSALNLLHTPALDPFTLLHTPVLYVPMDPVSLLPTYSPLLPRLYHTCLSALSLLHFEASPTLTTPSRAQSSLSQTIHVVPAAASYATRVHIPFIPSPSSTTSVKRWINAVFLRRAGLGVGYVGGLPSYASRGSAAVEAEALAIRIPPVPRRSSTSTHRIQTALLHFPKGGRPRKPPTTILPLVHSFVQPARPMAPQNSFLIIPCISLLPRVGVRQLPVALPTGTCACCGAV
uniref:Uncharacterized protein n=1 Tax=Mycena chlorophos TaxID=658473 RepID=A0ABQ0L9B6_MYCCL|nr:predicted protein [Mycena chlorophos]